MTLAAFSHIRVWCAKLAVAAALVSFAIPACAQSAAPVATPTPASREVVDEVGHTVRIPEPVQRIVSLAPSLTETLYALGLQDRLVGDTDYCDYPEDAQKKTKVGGAINPNMEVIASLRPDLVLVIKSLNRPDTVHGLDTLGIPYYSTDPHTVEQIISSTERLANILGAPKAGAAITEDMTRRLAELKRRLAPFPVKTSLFVVWPQPLMSVGKSSFIADALQKAGAVSIIDTEQGWPEVNLEEVVKLQPDYLIFAAGHEDTSAQSLEAYTTLPGWRLLDAVRNRRFAVISDAINRPAPRTLSAIEDLARQLHPEAFAEPPQNENPTKSAQPTIASLGSQRVAQNPEEETCLCAR